MTSVPRGYASQRIGARELVAHEQVAADIAAILAGPATLYDWAADMPQSRAMRGRAPVYVATLAASGVSIVVRHVWHGGLLAPLTGDRFRVPTRAPVELHNALRLRDAGIDSSEILGYVLYPAGAGLRRVDVFSRLIPDAHDLGAVISDLAPHFTVDAAFAAVRGLMVRMAHALVVHPDLNVKNILLTPAIGASLRPYVIDVDVVRFADGRAPGDVMRANAERLARSLRKWRTRFGAAVSDASIDAFIVSCIDAVPATHSQSRIA